MINLKESRHIQDDIYGGATGLKRDYNQLYKKLEEETAQRLSNIERGREDYINEIAYYTNANAQYQTQFNKVIADNKALYLRCNELETQLLQTNPNYANIQQNYNAQDLIGNGSQVQQGYEAGGIRSANRLQQLQREIDDLKRENYDLKIRLQAQIQSKGIPYSRSQIVSPRKIVSPVYTSPIRPVQSHENYCDSLISSNEHHNRAVLERCKSIVASHNYY